MKSIGLLNILDCPCPGTHYAACMEFIEGFTEYGYTHSCITNINDCKDKDIILLSNHKVSADTLNKINSINPDAVYILWYYHYYLDIIPFKKFILTGEQYYYPPKLQSHLKYHEINQSVNNYIPLCLRANESPSKVGTYTKTYELDGCFMGSGYKSNWVRGFKNILYHDIAHGLLSYDQRRAVHLKSRIGFGFHNDANVANSHVTQRVFEAMAYGCVVLSDNPAARDMTGGIVEYVSSADEFRMKYEFYLANPDRCREKELAGYEWVKKYGTNRYAAQLFLDKIAELSY